MLELSSLSLLSRAFDLAVQTPPLSNHLSSLPLVRAAHAAGSDAAETVRPRSADMSDPMANVANKLFENVLLANLSAPCCPVLYARAWDKLYGEEAGYKTVFPIKYSAKKAPDSAEVLRTENPEQRPVGNPTDVLKAWSRIITYSSPPRPS